MNSDARIEMVEMTCKTHGVYQIRQIAGYPHLTNRECPECAAIIAGEAKKLEPNSLDNLFGIVGRKHAECETHGPYVSQHITKNGSDRWTGCGQCSAERSQQAAALKLEEDRKIASIRRMERLIEQAEIPERFDGATFDNYVTVNDTQARILAKLRDYAEQFPVHHKAGNGLILSGHTGTGKTHLAIAIGREVVSRHGASFLFTTVSRIVRAITKTYGKNKETTDSDIYEMLAGIDLLVIDEVGVQNGSDFERNVLFEVVNRRYEDCMPTVLISNLGKDAIEKAVGERVMDRMRDGSKMYVFDWESARGKAA